MSMAYLKSDNAGCYQNASLMTSLKSIGERAGIHVRRYDFSDPQSGNDICDRKIAPMKGHIQRWEDERHDVITAGDMKEALDSYGGICGCRVTVSEADVSKAGETVEWKGISTLSARTNMSLRHYAFYDRQGNGSAKFDLEKPPIICEDLFMCEEEECVASFPTQGDLQVHMDTGRHIMVMERESTYDLARKKWEEKVTEFNLRNLIPEKQE